ncbi:MAG: 3D domain-containing protein [Rhodocyclaceae bacterium]|nr:3D domain-containing protein [Rhodocyclaceae bacterium]MCB1964432.1 3D domain-containing protein [Rhodocyclaceae bacterium]
MSTLVRMLAMLSVLGLAACSDDTRTLTVTATAYTSSPGETDARPDEAAWGDILRPGMKAIAVSRDLIDAGLDHGTEVSIEGLDGHYVVLDKMNRRWTEKIDIYMGKDVAGARAWGRRTVEIAWEPAQEE